MATSRKPAILCVDDEKIVLSSLKEQLKRHFKSEFTIEVVESGEEALEVMEELLEEGHEVPVVISDHIMPGIKGDELLIEIHHRHPKTLKILLTGQASAEAVGNAVNGGGLYRYISKPWERDDLILTVREAAHSYFQELEIERKNAELRRKVTTFFRFVPSQFLEVLGIPDDLDGIELGLSTERSLSVLFCDIRSFTTLSESMTPAENFRFINDYLSYLGPPIRDRRGFIDKYIGDAIMALFPSADDAVATALDMLEQLTRFNAAQGEAGRPVIDVGIGINTGPLMLGTVGEHDRLQTTVIGDTVNLAARTEGLTKTYRARLLVTQSTRDALQHPEQYTIRHADQVRVKGKSQPVDIFEITPRGQP